MAQPTAGVHKDGTFYLRATEPGHAKAIQQAAQGASIDLDHRKGPANHDGKTGTFDHFHAKDADHIRTILQQLHGGEAGEDEDEIPDEQPTQGDGGQHIHVHIHHGQAEAAERNGFEPPEGKKARPVQKAHHEAGTRTVHGKVVPVKAYDDRRQKSPTAHRVPKRHPEGHPQLLQEPERPKVEDREDVDHHRKIAEAHGLRARVATHEAKCKDTHHAAKDAHYDAATAHLRAAHAMIASGHDTEHPHVKAHMEQAQRHHDSALDHFKNARGKIDKGRQTTIDEAIADADKRNLQKAMGDTMGSLLATAQRWNVQTLDAFHLHKTLDLVPGARETAQGAALASAMGVHPQTILDTLAQATGGSLDLEDTALYLLEGMETARGLAKAWHTVKAHYRPTQEGRLEQVHAYQRHVPDEEHQPKLKAEAQRVYANMVKLLKGPESAVMPDFAMNVHLGPIGCTAKQMRHIYNERLENHQRDPRMNPHPKDMLMDLARSIVGGIPMRDTSTYPPTPDRLWLTRKDHQVSVTPFYNQHPNRGRMVATQQAWLISGFRMEPERKKVVERRAQDELADPGLKVPISYAQIQ